MQTHGVNYITKFRGGVFVAVFVFFAAIANAEVTGFRHTGANLQLVKPVPDFIFRGVDEFDEYGKDIAIGFGGQRYGLEVTVYLYPMYTRNIVDEFNGTAHALVQVHPNAEITQSGDMTMNVGNVPTKGVGGLFLYQENDRNIGSFLFLMPQQSGYVLKVRATYQRSQDKADEAMTYAWNSVNTILGKLAPIK